MPPDSSTLARPAISRTHSRASSGREIVQQQVVRPGSQRLAQFLPRADFDLDRQPLAACALQGLPHAARRGNVVVLDQDRVEQSHAVIGDAAGRGRPLLQPPQSGSGLARIQHAAVCAFHGVGESARRCSHAAQPLQKIQRHALAFEQRPRAPANRGQHVARGAPVAIALQHRQFVHAAALAGR